VAAGLLRPHGPVLVLRAVGEVYAFSCESALAEAEPTQAPPSPIHCLRGAVALEWLGAAGICTIGAGAGISAPHRERLREPAL
jgi:hypothetical protein